MGTGEGEKLETLPLGTVERLFEQGDDTLFYVKDLQLRYVAASRAFIEFCGARSRDAVVGLPAAAFFVASESEAYERGNKHVLRTLRPRCSVLNLAYRVRGAPIWLLCSNWPIVGHDNRPRGLAGVAKRLPMSDGRARVYARMAEAVDYLRSNFRSTVAIGELADQIGVSCSQVERDFVWLFGVPPQRYLNKIRIDAALDLLTKDRSIAAIAQECGYSDQSALTRHFKSATGISPAAYRRTLPAMA